MKLKTQKTLLVSSFVITTLGLTACGGDSTAEGGSTTKDVPTAAQVVITEENSEEVASEVISAVQGAEGVSEITTDLPIGVQIQTSGITLPPVTEIVSQSLQWIDLSKLSFQKIPVGVSVNETVPCDSGSLTLSGNVSDNGDMSAGDSLTIEANSCNLYGSTLNGNMSVDVISYSDSYSKMELSYSDFSITYSDYYDGGISIQIPNLNGVAETWGDLYWGDIEKMIVSSTGQYFAEYGSDKMSASMNNFVTSVEFVGAEERITYDGLIQSTVNGQTLGALDIETLQPMVWTYYGDYPASGQLKVYGAQGRLRLTANGDATVQVETDADEDGVYEVTQDINWDDLGSEIL